MKYKFQIFFILLIISLACQSEKKQAPKIYYFDLEGILKNQIQKLATLNPGVRKFASLGDKKEEKQYKIPNWEKELTFFLQTDINKPALKNSYTKKELLKGKEKTITYTTKDKKAIVRSLALKFDNTTLNLLNIEAELLSENFLFSSRKILKMSFVPHNKEMLIKKYAIKSKESILFLPENELEINAEITY